MCHCEGFSQRQHIMTKIQRVRLIASRTILDHIAAISALLKDSLTVSTPVVHVVETPLGQR
ncbi:hypothetical protein Desti_1164 [Desulfomonile tiedjei DSM 6799]|uniref:Uncharacterized protein n=1 Tax=Desulfomonile tiedjei (strain ATCC 49306 / DSM 6799 / DCB-1) TaxID=706587 RepID=I4C2T6_DESTA|nr:hypothetical protein Desti_1164 [Desulfomonile tiedjei DSM 6799]